MEDSDDATGVIEGLAGFNNDVKQCLVNYFSIKRKSGGAECTIEHTDGVTMVKFKNTTVLERVLKRDSHTVYLPGFGNKQLTLKPYCKEPPVLPNDTSTSQPDKNDDGALREERVVVCDLNEFDAETLKLYAEKITQENVDVYPLTQNKIWLDCSQEAVEKIQAVQKHAIGEKMMTIVTYTSTEMDEIIDKQRLILRGFPPTIKKEVVELYVASITDDRHIDIEYLNSGDITVVTFNNPFDWTLTLKKCANKLMRYNVKATMLEASACVQVDISKGSLCKDLLTLYFENPTKSGGGPLSNIKLDDSNAAAYLYFQRPSVAQNVASRTHKLKETELNIYPYYDELDSILGKQIPVADPEPFDLEVDPEIIRFISGNISSMDQLKDILNKANAAYSLDENGKITFTPNLDKEAVNFQSLASKWQQTAKIVFLRFCEKYSNNDFPCSTAAWKRVKQEFTKFNHVLVNYNCQKAQVSVTGRNQDVHDVCKQTEPIVKQAEEDIYRESQIISDQITLESPDKYHLLQMLKIEENLRSKFNSTELQFDEKSFSLTVRGMPQDFQKIKDEIVIHLKGISSKQVNISSDIVIYLKMLGRDQLNQYLFSSDIHARTQIKNNHSISITACDNHLEKAETFIKKHFKVELFNIPEESLHATESSEWKKLLSHLEENKVDSIPQVFINKNTDRNGVCTNISVAGFNQAVKDTCHELDSFCKKNLIITEKIPLKSKNILKYLQDHEKIFVNPTLLNKNIKIISDTMLEINGHPDDVLKIKNLISKSCSEIELKTVSFNKPGAAKYLRENKYAIDNISQAKKNCMILIDIGGATPFDQTGMQLKCQKALSANLKVSIYKGDIFKSQVDVIVNAADKQMSFKSGFGKVLSEAGGPNISRSCAQYIQDNGEPQPGTVVMSVPGNLPCKSVAHVICQLFEQSKGNVDISKVTQLKQALKKSFEVVGTRGHHSAAMPGFVFQRSGYPLDICTKALMDAVDEFSQVNDPTNYLTDVLFIDINDNVVNALEKALLSRVSGTPTFQMSLPAAVRKQTSAASTSPTHMTTKEGIKISLVLGSIETENSDVIINTTSANMKMDSGGVSSAIFRKVGPTLQNLVDNAIQGQSIRPGHIVKTDVTGLNLQCQAVYHTTLGSWGNGKHLQKCMKRCLEMAHQDGVSSISFPALGTGNLKYPAVIVSSMMFAEVINFSQNHQGTTLKNINFVIFNKDQLVISDFQAELAQQLLGKTVVPPALNIASNGAQRTIGNISVEVVNGDITKENVDAIVNSTNTTFDLNSGVSAAILAAAGPTVVLELANLVSTGAQPADGVVTTSPGNLKSKKIVHMVGQTDFAKMANSILKVLDECSKVNCNSVSFPALSTGKGGLAPMPVADTMLETFEKFSLQNPQSNVSHIRIIVCQPAINTAFIQALTQFQPGGKKAQPAQTLSSASNIEQYGLKLHGVTVQAVSGDITKETTDVIVNSTTNAIVFTSGVSGAILKAAGQVVVDECTKLGPQPGDAVVVTSGGALHCKHIVHMVGQSNPASIKSSVLKVLQECETQKATSVSFPATGTGAGSLSATVVASAMMDGIEEHVRVHALTSSLTLIRFVIFQPHMVNDFHRAMLNTSQITVGSTGIGTHTLRGLQTPLLPKKIPQIKSSYKNESVVIQVYGKPKKDVEDVCEQIKEIIEKNCMANKTKMDCVESVGTLELKKLESIAKTCDVRISIETTHISIEGLTPDVCSALFEVTQVVQELKIKVEKEKFEDNYVPKQDVPGEWEPMQPNEVKRVTLNPQSPEYKQVQAHFMKSLQAFKIIKIERIQNEKLYKVYQAMKTSVETSHKGQGIYEQLLFHGTQSDSIDNIVHYGFNRSYAGKNATAYGTGTYFAVQSSYSANDTYSKPDANGTKYMYQARVLTGSYCQGHHGMKEPPLKNNKNATERYDCVVDKPLSPTMFIIFYDNQAYPEYLISFSQ